MNKLLISTLHSITTPFDAFEIPGFENIMENGAFAYKEQMLHFPWYFKSIKNLLIFVCKFIDVA